MGHPFRVVTRNIAIVNSWTRPSNDIMISSVEEMKTVYPTTSQLLRAGVHSDKEVGQPLLCLSLLIAGLKAAPFMIEQIAPLIVDLIPAVNRIKGTTRNGDFDELNGNVNIGPIMELAMSRMSYILRHYSIILSEGQDVWNAWISCIRREGHIVMTLEDQHISALDPAYKQWRSILGGDDVFRSILIKHCVSGKIIALFNSFQIASNIGGVSADSLLVHTTDHVYHSNSYFIL